MNRAYPQKERKIYLESTVVDLEKAEVRHGKNQFSLTGKELLLLQKLAENAGRIVTTGTLCEAVCGEFWQGYESTLSTHIRHLREKIEENPSKPVSLVTIKGIGYRLNIKGGRNNEYRRTGGYSEYYLMTSKIYWYANSIPLQVSFSHICGGSFSEKPVGRSSKHLNEPNAFSKAAAKL